LASAHILVQPITAKPRPMYTVYRLGHGTAMTAMYGVSELLCDWRGCETDAGRRPAARPFFKTPKSAVRLPVSWSRRSRDLLSGSRTALWASRSNGLAAGRRPASRSRSRANHTKEVSYAIQCIRRRVLIYLLVVTPTPAPFAFLSAGTTCKPASVRGSTWRREIAQCRQALHVVQK